MDDGTELQVVAETPEEERARAGGAVTAEFVIVRWILAAVLLGAAGLKAHALIRGLPPTAGVLGLKAVQVVAVEFELLLAAWLMAGAYPAVLRGAAVASFMGLGGVALYRAVAGAPSCGCFGRLEVNPWWTATLDAIAVVALATAKLRREDDTAEARRDRRRLTLAGITWLAVGMPLGVMMARAEPLLVHVVEPHDELLGTPGGAAVLAPEHWVGKRFPLAPHIDSGDRLMTGRWTVVLYAHDCAPCRDALPAYEGRARRPGAPRMAFVSVPPHAQHGADLVPTDSACIRARLDASRDWFVAMPYEISLTDGIVTAHLPPEQTSAGPR